MKKTPGRHFIFLLAGICATAVLSAQNNPPQPPQPVQPINNDSCQQTITNLCVNVNDADGDTIIVEFWGTQQNPPPDFAIAGLPDTQFYTGELNGGSNAIFKAQNNWIVSQLVPENIVFTAHFGDCVQNADNNGNDIEWKRCDTSMQIIENPATTQLTEGIPYAMNVGNHDQSPFGNPAGTTVLYNQFFGVNRFTGRSYWGGNYGNNADNFFTLFNAGGIDFVCVSIEFDPNANDTVLHWAKNILQQYSGRKAIILSHYLLNSNATFSPQGQETYDSLKTCPNLFLMLCGHVAGAEASRSDTYNGHTVHTLLADFQSRNDGGDGWMRLMRFSPASNTMSVITYSPWLNQYETDANSQFTLSVDLYQPQGLQLIGRDTVIGTGTACVNWDSLSTQSGYSWYATASDGIATTTGATQVFYTYAPVVNAGPDLIGCGTAMITGSSSAGNFLWNTGDITATIFSSSPGTFILSSTSLQGNCTASDTVNVSIVNPPSVFLGNDTTICSWCSLTLNAGNGFDLYNWNTGSQNSSITVNNTGVYYVTITDSNGCTAADTISVTVLVGIQETAVASLHIYPNPTGSDQSVMMEYNKADDYRIEIFDAAGKIRYSENFSGSRIKIRIPDLAPGLYILRSSSASGEAIRARLLVGN